VTEPADPGQLRDLGIAFTRHRITRRPDRLLLLTDHTGRPITSSKELTRAEAGALLRRLRRLPIGLLPRALDRIRAAARDKTPQPVEPPAELTLFDATPIPPPEKISPDRRRTARQRALIAAGIHPLMGGPTHPDQGTCGTCAHRIHVGDTGRTWPKCDLHELTHGAGTDCRGWWPACGRYEPGDRVSDDAARWTPNHAHR
jgi:hypothetical protein